MTTSPAREALERIEQRLQSTGAIDPYIERDLAAVRAELALRGGNAPALKSALLHMVAASFEDYMAGEDGLFVESHLDNMLAAAGVTILDSEDKRRIIVRYRGKRQ